MKIYKTISIYNIMMKDIENFKDYKIDEYGKVYKNNKLVPCYIIAIK